MGQKVGRITRFDPPDDGGEWFDLVLDSGARVKLHRASMAEVHRLFGPRMFEAVLQFHADWRGRARRATIETPPLGWTIPIPFKPDLSQSLVPDQPMVRAILMSIVDSIPERGANNGIEVSMQRVRRHAVGLLAATLADPYHPDLLDEREFEMFEMRAADTAFRATGIVPVELEEALKALGPPALASWAIVCAEHVLGLYEARYPGDHRARDFVAGARALLAGTPNDDTAEMKEPRWTWAFRAKKTAAPPTAGAASAYLAAVFAHSTAHHSIRDMGLARTTATSTADYAVEAAWLAANDYRIAIEERAWQLEELRRWGGQPNV